MLHDTEFSLATVSITGPQDHPLLTVLAERLQSVITIDNSQADIVLSFTEGCLALSCAKLARDPVIIDFNHPKMQYLVQSLSKYQPLAKAVGLHKKSGLLVLDATGGLGQDAFCLAALDAEVVVLEQSPIVAALLQDGLARAAASKVAQRITCVEADARTFFSHMSIKPDVIYLDPMFPARSKRALASKEMQILQWLLGHASAQETLDLLAAALATRVSRVVLKRPSWVLPIPSSCLSHHIKGKLVRFDIYLPPS